MSDELQGKVALVTGASKGIGFAISERFVAAGAAVMLSSRKQDGLDAAANTISASIPGARVATFAANAGDPERAAACVDATMQQFGAIDILVNNAATNPSMGTTIDAELSAWDKTFQVNVRGMFVWAQLAWNAWLRDHGGVVLNMTSIGGLRADATIGVYNTTKAAIVQLTGILAAELGPGVRVNAIAPGFVKTDFSRALWEGQEDALAARLPLRRLGEPDDIASAALFLASDASSWITGHTLVVDGGALVGPPPRTQVT